MELKQLNRSSQVRIAGLLLTGAWKPLGNIIFSVALEASLFGQIFVLRTSNCIDSLFFSFKYQELLKMYVLCNYEYKKSNCCCCRIRNKTLFVPQLNVGEVDNNFHHFERNSFRHVFRARHKHVIHYVTYYITFFKGVC